MIISLLRHGSWRAAALALQSYGRNAKLVFGDRLARMYAYQVIVLDELARHGVSVSFHDTPRIEDDPQARRLTRVQGVIAEYERARIAERYRRGKLWHFHRRCGRTSRGTPVTSPSAFSTQEHQKNT